MDLNNPDQIKAHLMETSVEFRQLAEEHSQHDRRVSELVSRPYLTPEEQIEEVRLKKLKLHLKTQMQQMIDDYRMEHVS
jgi:uncharacterized protein YdcH (DUF465 family)